MANYATLKAAIQNVIKTNGTNAITGAILQSSLLSMINSLGADYQFVGVAVPSTNPGTPDQNVFYVAGPGTYPNFNNTTVRAGYIGFFKYAGSWSIQTVEVGRNYDATIDNILRVLTTDYGDVQTTYSSGYINASGGVSASNYAKHSDFVPIQSGMRYYVYSTSSDNWHIGYYSGASESAFVSSQALGPTTSEYKTVYLEIPNNVSHVRITKNTSNASKFGYISETLVTTPLKDVIQTQQSQVVALQDLTTLINTFKNTTLNEILRVLTSDINIVQTTYSSGYINSSGGVSSSNFAVHSDFVPIQSGIIYLLYTKTSDNWHAAFYSSANESSFISSQQIGATSGSEFRTVYLNIPQNAAYCRITKDVSADSKFQSISKTLVSYSIKDKLQDLQNQIDAIDVSQIDSIISLLSVKTKTDVQTTYSDGYINSNGTVSSSSFARHSDFIQIQQGGKYELYSKAADNWRIAYYSAANESSFISAQPLGETTTQPITINLVIPANAQYLRVTKDTTSVSKLQYVVENLMTTPVPDALQNLQTQINELDNGATYIVDPNGGGDYTGLVQALADLHDDETKKTIYIVGGVYDIFEEMGGQTFIDSIPADVSSSLWYQYSNFVPNNTSIIGLGEVTLNFNPPSTTPDAKMGVIGPIALRGNVHIENVTINASNCRYCIHDETGSSTQHFEKTYKNVKLFKSGSGYAQAYGAGHSKNNTIRFENCIFSSNAGPVWSVHDNSNADNTTIVLNNCAIIVPSADSTALRFGTLNATSGTKVVQINNCSLGGGKVYFDDSADMPNRYKLTLIKSGNPTFIDDSGANPFVPTVIQ